MPRYGISMSLGGPDTGWMESRSIICGTGSTLWLRYRLSGTSWIDPIPMPELTIALGHGSLKMVSDTDGWESLLKYTDYNYVSGENQIFRYDGRYWKYFQTLNSDIHGGSLNSYSFVPGYTREGWAMGPSGAPWRFLHNKWAQDLEYKLPFGLGGIFMNAVNDVWAMGSQGIVVHYDGNNWTQVSVPIEVVDKTMWDISFYDAGHGIVVGGQNLFQSPWAKPAVIFYRNGMWSWLPVPPPKDYVGISLHEVVMMGTDEAWALGSAIAEDPNIQTQIIAHIYLPVSGNICGTINIESSPVLVTPAPAYGVIISLSAKVSYMPDMEMNIEWSLSEESDSSLSIYSGHSLLYKKYLGKQKNGAIVWKVPSSVRKDNEVSSAFFVSLETSGSRGYASAERHVIVQWFRQPRNIVQAHQDNKPGFVRE